MLRDTAQPNYCLYRMDVNLQLSGGRLVTEAQEFKGLNAKTGPVNISSAHAGHSELLRGLSQFQAPSTRILLVHDEPVSVKALVQTLRRAKGWLYGEIPDHLEIKVLSEAI